ncbi:DUF4013 domain-containing protein [Natrinema amylolyticum]|uniref:DUF4013 domain-containing protein n=1 Tax=Natrinema amylolyticum TaxID=2878679 RepID=UPI001CF957FD|nr:DUF4013 domain-containing protein [Natrinema amylolyticum]
MSYCHDCDEEFEPGTILCPECGSKLAGGSDGTESSSGWSSDGSAADDAEWSSDDSTADDTGWSNDGSASTDAASGWSSDDSSGGEAGWSSGDSAGSSGATTIQQNPIPTASESGSSDPSEPRYHDTDIFEFSFAFPLGKGGKPLLIDSALVLFSFLLVTLPFTYGYSYRVGRAAARGDGEVPSFDDWGGLGRDGLLLIGVYLGVVIGLGAVTAAFVGAIAAVGESSSLVLPLIGIATLILLAGVYVAGAIVPVLIGTGSVRETFSNGRILEFAFSIHYLKGVVLLLVFSTVLSIAVWIVAVVLVITVVGIFLLIPLYFVLSAYIANLTFAMWGYIYNDAASAGDVEPVEPDAPLGLQ